MTEETALLAEMMLQTDLLCAQVEAAILDWAVPEISLKISQCGGALPRLQSLYEEEKLTLADKLVCAVFRALIISLLWLGFLARDLIDFRSKRFDIGAPRKGATVVTSGSSG